MFFYSYLELTSEENQKKLEEEHLALLDKIKKDAALSWPFLDPVDKTVPMYYEIIKDPIGELPNKAIFEKFRFWICKSQTLLTTWKLIQT